MLSQFRANQSLVLLLNVCLAQKQQMLLSAYNTELEPKIYHTQGKHVNHYTADMVVRSIRNYTPFILLIFRLHRRSNKSMEVDHFFWFFHYFKWGLHNCCIYGIWNELTWKITRTFLQVKTARNFNHWHKCRPLTINN